MRAHGRGLFLLLLVATLGLPGCHGRRVRGPEALDARHSVGVYRARFLDEEQHSRRFRLLLYAARPDRLHGEVLSPIGTTELIIDAGGGNIAVTAVDDRVSYVGPARADVFDVLFGIPVELEGLVAAILDGKTPGDGVTLLRRPQGPGLPSHLEVAAGGRRLVLELRRRQPLAAGHTLGRGEGPAGMAVRPLEDLDPELAPVRSAVETPTP